MKGGPALYDIRMTGRHAVWFVAGVLALRGQDEVRPRFDAASVKPSAQNVRTRWDFPPGQVVLIHSRLREVIPLAYELQPFLVSGGPGWFATDFWDIVGKLPVQEGAPAPARPQALQALQVLLEEQFQLKAHRESRTMNLYRLTVAKTGLKLTDGDDLPDGTELGYERRFASRIVRRRVPLANLVTALTAYLGVPVEDRTGLGGVYSFVLAWDHQDASDSDSAMIAAVRSQLGLNLERGKGPVQVLVIDSAERPAGNQDW